MNPTMGVLGCWAFMVPGHATTLPTSAMNTRRFMQSTPQKMSRGGHNITSRRMLRPCIAASQTRVAAEVSSGSTTAVRTQLTRSQILVRNTSNSTDDRQPQWRFVPQRDWCNAAKRTEIANRRMFGCRSRSRAQLAPIEQQMCDRFLHDKLGAVER